MRGLKGLNVDQINSEVSELYEPCCDHEHVILPNLADDISQAIEEMLQEIYRLQGTDGNTNAIMTKYFFDKMWTGAMKGFAETAGPDYDSPNNNMMAALKNNVSTFAVAKNYQQLKELNGALLGDDGQLRTFQQFKQAAALINDKYMKTWLETEYNLAVAGGQMAGKWVNISRDASTLPLLEFDAVLDNRTTALCRSLDKIILPINHIFWNRFYPPNHFGCRSTVRQLASGQITPEDKIRTADIPKMFQTNLAKQGLIFPEDHPYFIGLPDELKKPS